jgi:prepilin-type N-terminal cleavage/methylation domain-containing protein
MSGHCKQGFGLLEIIIALAIIAIVGTTIVPRLWNTDSRQERRNLLAQLNELLGVTQQQAIITGVDHKVEFEFPKITVMRATDKRTSEGTPVFEPVTDFIVNTEMTLPKHIEVKQFLVDGVDEMTRYVGSTVKRVWFFVAAGGIAQPVILNMIDKKDGIRTGKGRQISWVLNPFSAQFKEYNEFQQ